MNSSATGCDCFRVLIVSTANKSKSLEPQTHGGKEWGFYALKGLAWGPQLVWLRESLLHHLKAAGTFELAMVLLR